MRLIGFIEQQIHRSLELVEKLKVISGLVAFHLPTLFSEVCRPLSSCLLTQGHKMAAEPPGRGYVFSAGRREQKN